MPRHVSVVPGYLQQYSNENSKSPYSRFWMLDGISMYFKGSSRMSRDVHCKNYFKCNPSNINKDIQKSFNWTQTISRLQFLSQKTCYYFGHFRRRRVGDRMNFCFSQESSFGIGYFEEDLVNNFFQYIKS